MGNLSNLLFAECSTPDFIKSIKRGLEDSEMDNQDAVMAAIIVKVNWKLDELVDANFDFNCLTFTDVANVSKSIYVGMKHGVSIPPSAG